MRRSRADADGAERAGRREPTAEGPELNGQDTLNEEFWKIRILQQSSLYYIVKKTKECEIQTRQINKSEEDENE